jgi:hypothetical protein
VARDIRLTVDPEQTAGLQSEVTAITGVLGVAVLPGASVSPPGDLLLVTATDAPARDVLRLVDHTPGVPSTSTTEPLSLTSRQQHDLVAKEVSESTWNDVEGQFRRESNPGLNFLLLMLLSGAIAAAGIVAARSTS